jgi:hypothetical protein
MMLVNHFLYGFPIMELDNALKTRLLLLFFIILTFIFVQFPNFMLSNCNAACIECLLPNGDVINIGTARFNFEGVLLNDNARQT